jgi:predicted DNA-binding WGR domain protein
MARREFQFIEGSAKKFWSVEVEDTNQKVHFGRIGTAGQAQTKEFATEAEAKKATEKLIAEKVKKGYSEVMGGTNAASTPTPTAKAKRTVEDKDTERVANAAQSLKEPDAEPAVTTPSAVLGITRTIELDPADWQCVTWRKRVELERPTERPFDFESCQQRLQKLKKNTYGWVEWTRAHIGSVLSRQEAHFWFLALTENSETISPAELASRIHEHEVTGQVTRQEAVTRMKTNPRLQPSLAFRALINLLEGHEVLELMQDENVMSTRWDLATEALTEFTRQVFPYLSTRVFENLKNALRPQLDPVNWPTDFYKRPPMAFFIAAFIGMHDELLKVVRSIQPGTYSQSGWDHSYYHQTQRIVFGLGNAQLVQEEMRRLRLHLQKPDFLRTWLALTEFDGLDYVCENILAETKKDVCEELLKVFALVKAPEAAPFMLELKLNSKAPHIARQWLDENVGCAIAGLIPVAAGRGKLAESALEYLREAKKKGHEKLIRECLAGVASDVADSIRRNVLDFAEKEYAVHDAKSLPADLKAALEVKSKKGKAPAWATVASLPPIVVGDKKLGDAHATALIEALSRSPLEAPDPLIPILKQYADAASLDDFAWRLFQLWQGESTPPKEKWAMGAVGLIGSDASALKLTPLIRNWPGESQHQRAVFGLECLRTIGSDTALMQLNGIAQKLKFKGLKEKAAQAMEAIAKDKGLTRSQLEDRIVPDCDLDERGSRVFDFGPRQFRFVLGPEMKPMIKDSEGKVKTDLPKPGAKDDSAKADAAVSEWKLLKKQIKEVATIQAQRLEQAMVTGRRWPIADFETLLVKHPLMTNLVRLLLWGGYDSSGKLVSTFRVTEDQTFANMKDDEYEPAGIETVGIVHPLHLTAEQQSTWGEVFSDYELIPPFRQLGRRVVRPEPEELKASEITRFQGIAIPAPTLVYGLEKLGWIRGTGMDGGGFDEHSKPFPAANVTAVVHYDGSVGFGFIDPNESLKISTCYFVSGIRSPTGYAHKEQTMLLRDLDPVAISEVLTDLSALAAKGK